MKKKNQKQEEELLGKRANPRFLSSLLLLLFSISLWAVPHFDFNKSCLKAQELTYQLQLKSGRSILLEQQKTDPENAAVEYLLQLNYIFEVLITEDEEQFKEFHSTTELALEKIRAVSNEDAFTRFSEAEITFYWAVVKGKFEHLYSAAMDVKRAYSLLEENQEAHPNFAFNKKGLGLIHAFLSTVPEQYTWAVKLLGLNGSLKTGLAELKSAAYSDPNIGPSKYLSKEASYLYAYTLYHIAGNKEQAWMEMQRCTKDIDYNLLSVFFKAILANKLQKNEVVISTLTQRPKTEAYISFYYLEYLLGNAKLFKLDESAETHLKTFLTNYKGKNYVKACLLKLSWNALIHDKSEVSESYKHRIKDEGAAINEEDKMAMLYLDKPSPNIALLKTRLLFDGGYYQEALNFIRPIKSSTFESTWLKAEYAYRKGRLYAELEQMDLAIKFYKACALFAMDSPEYYGAYACLYLAEYYKSRNEPTLAKEAYEQALKYNKNKEYVNSIEQKAELGLKSLK